MCFQYVRHAGPETLLEFLLRRFPYHTPGDWEQRIRTGAVTIEGAAAEPGHVLNSKERIVYVPPRGLEPEVDGRYRVLFEDGHLLAVEKSGNIPSSPSGKYWHNSLRNLLLRERGLADLYPVHRLDRETSGVNLFAKSLEAARSLGAAFAAGEVRKTYAAILRGRLPVREIFVAASLLVGLGQVRVKQAVHPQGKPARTEFRLREHLPGASLVQVVPLTGRTHQIRAHASYLGYPVWGDRLYGVTEEQFLAWVKTRARTSASQSVASRHLLHAERLALRHPVTGAWLELESPPGSLLASFQAQQSIA